MSKTYTVCILDANNNPTKFIRPNFSDPARALAKLRTEKQHRKGSIVMVTRLSVELMDEEDLEREIERKT